LIKSLQSYAISIASTYFSTNPASPGGRVVVPISWAGQLFIGILKPGKVLVRTCPSRFLSLLANTVDTLWITPVVSLGRLVEVGPVGGALSVIGVVESGIWAIASNPGAGPSIVWVSGRLMRFTIEVVVGIVSHTISAVAGHRCRITVSPVGDSIGAEFTLSWCVHANGLRKTRGLHVVVLGIVRKGVPIERAFSIGWVVKLFGVASSTDPDAGPPIMGVSCRWDFHAVEESKGEVTVAASAVTRSCIGVAFSSVSHTIFADFPAIWTAWWVRKTVESVVVLCCVI